MRSLAKASSFSFEASTLAKSGMRRSRSTSSLRLTRATSPGHLVGPIASFGLSELAEHGAGPSELEIAALLDEAAIRHHQDPVEMPRQARPMQDPDEAALGAGVDHRLHHLGL